MPRVHKPAPVDMPAFAPLKQAARTFDPATTSDTHKLQLAAAAIQAQAEAARHDPVAFFNFVMREEKSQARVTCAPHQRVLFNFVMAHPRCVVRMPAGASKTFCMAALTLFLLGQDVTQRGAIVSATQDQAHKPLGMVRDYIESSVPLRLVFPVLARSQRSADPWTQTAITVARPHGIRDPSLRAVGIGGALPGARLSWVIVDDILNIDNTTTPAGRQSVHDFFDSTVLSRLDPTGSRLVVTNTPWHPDDITYRLEQAGWPTLTMDVRGGIQLANCDDWDTDDIRPSRREGEWYRLSAHDPDEAEAVTLWPDGNFSPERVDTLQREHLPHRFNQQFMCQCRDDESARCKIEWIETCKRNGAGLTLVSEYTGPNPTVTGVDLAVGLTNKHDETAFFTFECLPNGMRRILDVETGHWDGPTIVAKVIRKARQYNSIVRVENNAAQEYILQFIRTSNAAVPVKAHTTGRNKAHPDFGVESMFVELQNGGWIIPTDRMTNRCHSQVQKWIDACLNYEPDKHTDDVLMAAWLAREMARDLGFGRALPSQGQAGGGPSLAMNIMSR